ncbi:S-adenosylmethionine uptake transporter [Diplonema papillatum]|nr:S-adenosylmethionine uptake transporter [Diplonema papillatum]
MNVVLFYALISALLVGTIQLILKHMGKTEDADTLVAWNLIITVPIGPAFYFWATPTATEWILLALQGVLGAVNQFTATKAFQYADASLVAPIDFVRLPFVAAAAYFIFGEVADRATRIGASLIFIAVLLIAASSKGRVVCTVMTPPETHTRRACKSLIPFVRKEAKAIE